MAERKRRPGFHDEVVALIQAALPPDVTIQYEAKTSKRQRYREIYTEYCYVIKRGDVRMALMVETASSRGSIVLVSLALKKSNVHTSTRYNGYTVMDQLDTFVEDVLRNLDEVDKASAVLNSALALLCQDGQFQECKVINKGIFERTSLNVILCFDFGDDLYAWGSMFVVDPSRRASWGDENELKVYVHFDGPEVQVASGEKCSFKDLREHFKRYVAEAIPKMVQERDNQRNSGLSAKLVMQLRQEIEELPGITMFCSTDPTKVEVRVSALLTPDQVRAVAAALKTVGG